MSIYDLSEKGKDVLTVIIIILVGLISFELGRLSKENRSSNLKIEYPAPITGPQGVEQEASAISAVNNLEASLPTASKNFFASKKGKKYYSLSCSAGKSIKQENRVYFETREGAEKAGYALSSSCR